VASWEDINEIICACRWRSPFAGAKISSLYLQAAAVVTSIRFYGKPEEKKKKRQAHVKEMSKVLVVKLMNTTDLKT
jgi:hypothetical protein